MTVEEYVSSEKLRDIEKRRKESSYRTRIVRSKENKKIKAHNQAEAAITFKENHHPLAINAVN